MERSVASNKDRPLSVSPDDELVRLAYVSQGQKIAAIQQQLDQVSRELHSTLLRLATHVDDVSSEFRAVITDLQTKIDKLRAEMAEVQAVLLISSEPPAGILTDPESDRDDPTPLPALKPEDA